LCCLDKVMGLIIVGFGCFFSYFKIWNIFDNFKFMYEFMGEIIFLNWIFGGLFSWVIKPLGVFFIDFTWNEILGSKSIFYVILKISQFYIFSKSFVLKSFFFFIFLIIMWISFLLFSLYRVWFWSSFGFSNIK